MSSRKKIIEEAADWFLLIESDQASNDDISEFVEWLELSPAHQVEYDAITALWADGADLIDIYGPDISSLNDTAQGRAPSGDAGFVSRWKKMRVGIMAAAAMLFLTLSVGIMLNYNMLDDGSADRNPGISYHTEKGESKRIRLSDGSYVHLNTKSDILVRFSDRERSIFLVDGEAFFEVKQNPDRPFVVRSDSATVTALGTKFSVESFAGADFAVTVTEGKVLVTSILTGGAQQSSASAISQINLGVGESIRVKKSVPLTERAIEKVDLSKILPWRIGKLLFEEKPLADVVTDFNRYNERVIVIVDPSLNDLLISGYFDAHDPDGFLNVIEKLIAVRVVSVSENEIRLLKKQS